MPALEQEGGQQSVRTCKAWMQVAPGEPSNPQLLKMVDRKVGAPRPGQLVVKVASAALNPIDFKISEGKMPMGKVPLYMGSDFAGEVVEATPESGFTVGQEVFGDCRNSDADKPPGGSLSEYMLVNKTQVALKPNNLTFAEASGLSLTGGTVLECLKDANLSAGARVVILGASGGVGTAAVQICKARGHHVIGVCSAKNKDLVTSLGADEVIDYKEKDWSVHLQQSKINCVFDFAPSGPDSTVAWDKAKQVMVKGGKFITISGPSDDGTITLCSLITLNIQKCFRNMCSGFQYSIVVNVVEANKLQELAKMCEDGKVRVVLDKTYGFAEVNAAFKHLESGRAVGKICVSVPS